MSLPPSLTLTLPRTIANFCFAQMSRRTFTDNIINLAVERSLVRHLPDIFSPSTVGQLTDEKIQELAAESEHTQAHRVQLTQEIATLRQGLEKCRKWKPRNGTSQAAIVGAADSSAAAGISSSSSLAPAAPSPSPSPAGKASSPVPGVKIVFPSIEGGSQTSSIFSAAKVAATPFGSSTASASPFGRSAASTTPSPKPQATSSMFGLPAQKPLLTFAAASGDGLFGSTVPKPAGTFGETLQSSLAKSNKPSFSFTPSEASSTERDDTPTNSGGMFGGGTVNRAGSPFSAKKTMTSPGASMSGKRKE